MALDPVTGAVVGGIATAVVPEIWKEFRKIVDSDKWSVYSIKSLQSIEEELSFKKSDSIGDTVCKTIVAVPFAVGVGCALLGITVTEAEAKGVYKGVKKFFS